MRNKKKFNEFMNKTIEELKEKGIQLILKEGLSVDEDEQLQAIEELEQEGTRLPKYLERFLRILRMQDCLLPPAQQSHTERI